MMDAMIRVTIDVHPRAYEALIERGLIARAGEQIASVLPPDKYRKLFVITVAPLKRRWANKLSKSLSVAGFKSAVIDMSDGEKHKPLATVETFAEKLIPPRSDPHSA